MLDKESNGIHYFSRLVEGPIYILDFLWSRELLGFKAKLLYFLLDNYSDCNVHPQGGDRAKECQDQEEHEYGSMKIIRLGKAQPVNHVRQQNKCCHCG